MTLESNAKDIADTSNKTSKRKEQLGNYTWFFGRKMLQNKKQKLLYNSIVKNDATVLEKWELSKQESDKRMGFGVRVV